MEFDEDQFIMISGIQHFAFCQRQWALIHVEQQWSENLRTVQGEAMHENAHDAGFTEKRGNTLTVRDMRVFSRSLGISGACDVVEFISDKNGISLSGRDGLYRVLPIEYKHGKPKDTDMDILQLAAQAMCLEEMLCCHIDSGMLYYGEIRKRMPVCIDDAVKNRVKLLTEQMRDLLDRGYTPKVKPSKACNACSLNNLCLPKLMKNKSASQYLRQHIQEDDL